VPAGARSGVDAVALCQVTLAGRQCPEGSSGGRGLSPDYSCRVPKIFSNLNLNGSTPPRVQPNVGEWGPVKVPSTKKKKRMRIWASLALFGAMLAIFLLGWYVYFLMTGSWGFGIGEK
jgi:hypothetical protein